MFVFIILWVRAEPSWMSFPLPIIKNLGLKNPYKLILRGEYIRGIISFFVSNNFGKQVGT